MGRDLTACGNSARASASACRFRLGGVYALEAAGFAWGCEETARKRSVPHGFARVTAVKAGWLNVTLTNHRDADALDGVLGAVRNTLLCVPDVSPAF